MQKRTRRAHGIRARKISVSVGGRDLDVLVAHAKRSHGGNVSAVIAELVASLARADAADEVLAELGGDRVTDADMDAIRAQVFGVRKKRRAA